MKWNSNWPDILNGSKDPILLEVISLWMKLWAVAHLPSSEKGGLERITKFQAKKSKEIVKTWQNIIVLNIMVDSLIINFIFVMIYKQDFILEMN